MVSVFILVTKTVLNRQARPRSWVNSPNWCKSIATSLSDTPSSKAFRISFSSDDLLFNFVENNFPSVMNIHAFGRRLSV